MIGLLSDSHDNHSAVREAVRVLRGRAVDLVIHCGDVTTAETLSLFAGVPLRLVLGNNDCDVTELRRTARRLGCGEIGEELHLTIEGKRLLVYHGTEPARLRRELASAQWDYILTGHTHRVADEQHGPTRLINPGALWRAAEYTVALLSPGANVVSFINIPRNS